MRKNDDFIKWLIKFKFFLIVNLVFLLWVTPTVCNVINTSETDNNGPDEQEDYYVSFWKHSTDIIPRLENSSAENVTYKSFTNLENICMLGISVQSQDFVRFYIDDDNDLVFFEEKHHGMINVIISISDGVFKAFLNNKTVAEDRMQPTQIVIKSNSPMYLTSAKYAFRWSKTANISFSIPVDDCVDVFLITCPFCGFNVTNKQKIDYVNEHFNVEKLTVRDQSQKELNLTQTKNDTSGFWAVLYKKCLLQDEQIGLALHQGEKKQRQSKSSYMSQSHIHHLQNNGVMKQSGVTFFKILVVGVIVAMQH